MRTTNRQKSDNPIVDRIDQLLKEHHKTQKDLTNYLGLPNGSYTRWRYENGRSYMDHIDAIADYFGVTPNYLIRAGAGEVGVETLSKEEIELILNVRQLTNEKRKLIFDNAKWLNGK